MFSGNKEYIYDRDGSLMFHESSDQKTDANNGVFDLDSVYENISISQRVAINGKYDHYYSVIDILIPIPGNNLETSREIFNLEGTLKRGEKK